MNTKRDLKELIGKIKSKTPSNRINKKSNETEKSATIVKVQPKNNFEASKYLLNYSINIFDKFESEQSKATLSDGVAEFMEESNVKKESAATCPRVVLESLAGGRFVCLNVSYMYLMLLYYW